MNRSAWLWGVLVLVASCVAPGAASGTEQIYYYRGVDGRTYMVQAVSAPTSEPTVTYAPPEASAPVAAPPSPARPKPSAPRK